MLACKGTCFVLFFLVVVLLYFLVVLKLYHISDILSEIQITVEKLSQKSPCIGHINTLVYSGVHIWSERD